MTADDLATRLVIAIEAHVSVARLVAAVALFQAGVAETGRAHPALVGGLLASGGLAAAAALVPWLWPAVSLGRLRALGWSAAGGAFVLSMAGLFVLDLRPLLATQLLLSAGVFAELRGGRPALRWFWASIVTLVAVALVYYLVVPLRPVPD